MGMRNMHAARGRVVTEATKLTPFAQAYFKLWRSKAGMDGTADIDALEKEYKRGNVTDADLRKNAPKSWLALLPKLEGAQSKSPAVEASGASNPKVVPWDKEKTQFAVKFTTRKGETLWTGDGWKHSMDLGRDEDPALFPSEVAAKKAIEQSVLKYIARWQPGYWQDFVRGWNPPAGVKIESGNFGFGEDLAADIAMEKLLGHNFIDDGNLLESDGQDPGSKIRAQLVKMDGMALEIRKGLNGLVREGIGMIEEASRVDLGEGSATLASMKPVLSRLMTAYTEIVAGLQAARESVGYDVEGPSVTSLPDEGEMQERITKQFARRKTHGIAR